MASNGRIPMISTGLPFAALHRAPHPPRRTLPPPPLLTLTQQRALLLEQAPTGFRDPAWIDAHRRPPRGAPRKRHLAAQSERARKSLARATLARKKPGQVFTAATRVLQKTDLVPLGEVKELIAARSEPLCEALAALLTARSWSTERFAGWLDALEQALGKPPSWALATALPALLDPQARVCATPLLDAQARLVTPTLRIGSEPTAAGYAIANRIALATRKALADAGEEPADLLDVRAFVDQTLGPEAITRATAS